MVCAPPPEARVQCVVRYLPSRDFTNCRKYEVTLPSSTAVKELVVNVARMMKLEPFSIQLRLQTKTGLDKVFKESSDGILSDSGFCTDLGARNSLVLEGVDGLAPRTAAMAPEAEANETGVGACDGGTVDVDDGSPNKSSDGERQSQWNPTRHYRRNNRSRLDRERAASCLASGSQAPVPPLMPSSDSERNIYTFSMPIGRSSQHHGFVGLVNQAMTCYLNSLLQALYMTPEFRNAVYKWKFVDSDEVGPADSIPFQLQKLFVNLQTSSKPAVETTELTQSFGWKSSDVWQQQDIQELCRVMFDALENQFKGTDQADLIKLYEGKMMDYVKCSECKTEKSREDTFLDIPLSIRPFGSNAAYRSVEEALDGFVQPEILQGNNQYFCESCNKKCDAHKGLKFTEFPYILTLHLKRFDFDYATTNRIKLNDKVEFPMTLNLNSFVDGSEFQNYLDLELQGDETGATALSPSSKCDDSSKADSVLDEDTNNSVEPPSNDLDLEVDEGIDVSASVDSDTKNSSPINSRREAKGRYMYELYSIMIHSGSASGGHYYAYIKDLAKNEWYCFNDQLVSKITEAEIKKTYGGGPARSFYSGAYSSSTNAYMLMYRRIDPDENSLPMTVEEFPPHIKDILKDIREKEEEERAFREREESMVKLHVHVIDPVLGKRKEQKVSVDKDCTFSNFFEIAYNQLNVSDIAPVGDCRLVAYNKITDMVARSFEGQDDATISSILSSLPNENPNFLIEIKESDQVFLPCGEGDVTVPACFIDHTSVNITMVRYLHLARSTTLLKMKKTLGLAFRVACTDFFVAILDDGKDISTGSSEDSTILLNTTCRIFLSPTEDCTDKTAENKFFSCVNIFRNVIFLNVSIPDVSEEKLNKLHIPSLHEPKEDASDTTPTGDGQMIASQLSPSHFNDMVEEDAVTQELGCTSDQSASEDSSLADSERTMVGDPQNESHLSSASDSETKENGFDDNRDSSYERDLFFKASPFKYKHIYKMLQVIVDRDMPIEALKKRLEEYVGVRAKYMVIRVPSYTESGGSLIDFKTCRDDDVLHIKLHRVPEEDEQTARIHSFSPNTKLTSNFLFEWIVTKRSKVADIKKALYKYMRSKYETSTPYENFRLRKKKDRYPGRVLLDDEYILKDDSSASLELYVEELSSPEKVNKNTKALIFTRHWQPSTRTFGPYQEIALDVLDIDCLKDKIAEISSIPVDQLELSEPSKFGLPTSELYMGLNAWEKDGHEKIRDSLRNGDTEFLLFYKDGREESDAVSENSTAPESVGSVNSNQSIENGRTGTESSHCRLYASEMSIYNSYKKERELKIRVVKVPKPE